MESWSTRSRRRKPPESIYTPLDMSSHRRPRRLRLTLFELLPETNTSPYLVLAVHLLAAFSLAIGFHTRTSAALAFISLLSLFHRNPAVFHGGDTLMRALTFLLIFSRAGQAFSVDHHLEMLTVQVQTGALGKSNRGSPWCERLMQLQVCLVYLNASFWKLRGELWRKGTAVYYTTQADSLSRLRLPECLQHAVLIRLATWSTMAAQQFFCNFRAGCGTGASSFWLFGSRKHWPVSRSL